MKKFVVLAGVAVAALFVVRRSQANKKEAALWKEATAPAAKK
jgi:hypothetical protein